MRSAHLPLITRLIVFLGALSVLIGVAWWMTGPKPTSADANLPKAPPPLILPSGADEKGALAKAATQLAVGDLMTSRSLFIRLVASEPDDVVGQTGLILTGWGTTGPRSVERDLAQLVREYPDDPFPAVHLGMVQAMIGQPRSARDTLQKARDLSQQIAVNDSNDSRKTALRLARVADDLTYPKSFRGYLPVLVRVDEVAKSDRATLKKLLRAVEQDDRLTAARIADDLSRSPDPMLKIAAAAASFSKDDPQSTAERLRLLANKARVGASGSAESVATSANEVHYRALLHSALAELWSGDDRESSCQKLNETTANNVPAETRKISSAIHKEVCAKIFS